MTFTTALQSHLATQDLANQHMQHAQILGLGGKHFLNFSRDSLQPSLGLETEDYVSFGSKCFSLLEKRFVDALSCLYMWCLRMWHLSIYFEQPLSAKLHSRSV